MMHVLKSAWSDMLKPIFQRPNRVQVAALCHRQGDAGTEVLLITSRDTGRWIVPKGWPIDGLDGSAAALQEAWEEAGVQKARANPAEIGIYHYDKVLDAGMSVPVSTYVYAAEVVQMADNYPDAEERTRQWMSTSAAANKVAEPELAEILRSF